MWVWFLFLSDTDLITEPATKWQTGRWHIQCEYTEQRNESHPGRWEAWDFITLLRMRAQFKTCTLLVSRILHLILSDYSWPQITEPCGVEPWKSGEGLLYCKSQREKPIHSRSSQTLSWPLGTCKWGQHLPNRNLCARDCFTAFISLSDTQQLLITRADICWALTMDQEFYMYPLINYSTQLRGKHSWDPHLRGGNGS